MSGKYDHGGGHAGHTHSEENLSDRQLIFAVAINVLLSLSQMVGGIADVIDVALPKWLTLVTEA
ncbi:hypothetical protein [Qipengyuania sp.]|uniref:hypothetical protein n=1 Tax=Qipengyuania sp. TaxID=2004515 RepID=UPI0035118936